MRAHLTRLATTSITICLFICYPTSKAAPTYGPDRQKAQLKHTLQCTSQHPSAQGQTLTLTTIGNTDIFIDDQAPPADEVSRAETPANFLLTYRFKGKVTATAVLSKKMNSARLSRTTPEAANVFWFCFE